MRPPFPPSPIARIGIPPDHDDPNAVTVRPRGSRQPHSDATFAKVRRLIEESALSYEEIRARTGVSHASICRWTRDHGWTRPPLAPRASTRLRSATSASSRRASASIPTSSPRRWSS